MKNIAVTFDVDWALEEVIQMAVGLVNFHGIKATFFATHDSAVLRQAEREGHEIGLHPFFRQGEDHKKELFRLLDMYPQARGVRNHRFALDSSSVYLFAEAGLTYDSNIMAHDVPGVPPYSHHTGLIRFPVHFGDSAYLQYCLKSPSKLVCEESHDTLVMLFHPIHVFLNTVSTEHYNTAKRDGGDISSLASHVAPQEARGIMHVCSEACRLAKDRSVLLKDVAEALTASC